jgi:hypothetical protein
MACNSFLKRSLGCLDRHVDVGRLAVCHPGERLEVDRRDGLEGRAVECRDGLAIDMVGHPAGAEALEIGLRLAQIVFEF